MGEALHSLEEGGVDLLVQGGPVLYFVLLVVLFLLIAAVKGVVSSVDEKIKDFVKDHFAVSLFSLLLALFFVFTKHYVSAGLVVAATLAWFIGQSRFAARKWLFLATISVLLAGSYVGEVFWQRSYGPRCTYVVLAFENAGVGNLNDRAVILSSWVRFGSIMAEIFSDVPSIRIQPETLNEKSFDSLSLEPKRSQVIEALERGNAEKELILRTTVELEAGDKAPAMKLLSAPQRLGHSNLIDLGVFIVKRGTLKDIDHLALSIATALVGEIQPFEAFRLSPTEENGAMRKILTRYRSFLDRNGSPSTRATSAAVGKLLSANPISRTDVVAALEQYSDPLLGDSEGEKDRLTRRAQLFKLRTSGKPEGKQ